MISQAHSQSHFYILIGIVLAISFLEICGQTCIREYRKDGRLHFIIFAVVMYLAVIALLFHSYKYHGMGMVNLVWSCVSIIMAIAVGCIVFNETFNHYMAIAIALALTAVVFANRAYAVEK